MDKCVSWQRSALFSLLLMCSGGAFAHAMPAQNTPAAGAVLAQAPATVVIRFDSELEPLFSRLIVKDDAGKQVSKGNGKVDPANPTLLTAELGKQQRGVYHVYWSVVARDGHRTQGDYRFTVK